MKKLCLTKYKPLKENVLSHLDKSNIYFYLPKFVFCLSLIFLPFGKLFSQVVNPGNSGIIQDGFGSVPYLPSPHNSVFVSGNYAYVATGNGLEIVDITIPGLPLHKGSVTNGTGGALLLGPQSVYVSGNYAYVASKGSRALEIIDVSNPVAPVHKGNLTNGTGGALLNAPYFVYVSGNYAYVTNNTNNGAGDIAGSSLEIIDVSNPAAPVHKGSITDGGGVAPFLNLPYSVYVSGNFAYVASRYSNALEIIDVTNPSAPVHKGSIINGAGGALLSAPVSVYVSVNYAYVASYSSSALEIIDVTNPALPVHKGSITSITNVFAIPTSVYISGNYAYVTNQYGLAIFDVTNPATPVLKGSATDASIYSSNTVYLSGNYAYVTNSQGLGIIDVSNLTTPVLKGFMTNGTGGASLAGPFSVYVSGNYAYVVSSGGIGSAALEVVDISNPAAPTHKGSLKNGTGGALLQGPKSVYVSGNYAYVASANNNGTLEIIDVTNPAVPLHKGSISDGTGGASLNSPNSVYVVGNYAYVASSGSNALEIVDVTNPAAPVHKGSLINGGSALLVSPQSVYVSGNYAYVASFGSNALEIVDVTNPAAPVHKGSLINGSGGALLQVANSVFVSGNYAYVGSYFAFEIVDVTNPASPVHKGSLANGSGGALLGSQATVYVSGNYAYVVSSSNALEIINVTNPATPVHYASLTDGTGGVALADPYSLFISGNYAYVVSWSINSLQIVFLDSPSISGFTPSGQVGSSITITGQNFDTFVSTAINGIPASITGVTATTLNVTVPGGATTGPLSITYTGFKVTSANNFIVTPTAAAATNLQQTSFTANWSDVGIGGYPNGKYVLDVSTDNFNTYVNTYNNLSVGKVISYSVTGLSPGNTYQWRVRSTDGTTISGNSNPISILTIPATPTANATTAISQTGFTANWGLVANATGYYLDVASDAGFTTMVPGYNNLSLSSSATSQVVSGLNSGTYYYRVRSSNASGPSVSSSIVTVITLPSNPATTAATSITAIGYTANWSSVGAGISYFLDVSTDNFATFAGGYNNTNVGTVTTLSVSGLSSGTSYQYLVRANNSTGSSGNSNITSVLTLPAAPPAITATGVLPNQFNASWNKVTGATGYLLDVAANNGFSPPISLNIPTGDVSTYLVSALSNSTTYYYRLRASNQTGNSAYSNIVSVTTLAAAVTTPSSALTFTNVGSTTLTLNFNGGNGSSHLVVASAGSPLNAQPLNATGYTASLAFGSGSAIGNGYVISSASSPINMTNLSSQTTYYFQIFDYNGSGVTANYNNTSAPTASQITLAPLPAGQPSGIAFSNVTTSSTAVSFAAAAGNPTGYLVLRASGATPNTNPSNGITYSTGSTLGNAIVANVGSSLSFFDAGLVSNTAYYYNVYALNGTGNTTNYLTATPLQGTILTVPSNPVTSTVSLSNINATGFLAGWTRDAGASSYLDVSSDNFVTFVGGYNNLNVGTAVSYSITGLSSGTNYQYRVRAYNISWTSGNSNSTTVLTVPSSPNTLPATNVTPTSFSATWTKVTGATGYLLDVAANNGFSPPISLNIPTGDVSSYLVSALSTSTTYYYRLRASNQTGNSAYSNIVSVTTLAAALSTPSSALSFTNVGSTTLTLNFNGGNGSSHLVVASAGSPLNAQPLNATGYTASLAFGSGSAIGNGYVISSASSPINMTNLSSQTTYYFQIFDYNGSGITANYNSTGAPTASQITLAPLPAGQPSGIAFSNVTTSSIAVSFAAAAGNPTGYLVLRASGATPNTNPSNGITYSTGSTLGNAIVANVGSSLSFFDAGLVSNTAYYYNVYALNGTGNTTNYLTTTPLQGTTLTVPSNPVTSTVSLSNINATGFLASWTKDAGASSYLDVSSDNFVTFVGGYNNLNVGTAVSYSITGLSSGTNYQYRVRAYNSSWTSGNSNSTTVLTVPSSPNTLPATNVTPTSFSATWTKVTGATAYFLDVADNAAFTNPIKQNTPAGNAASFLISGLTAATTYYYRVNASDASGSSSVSQSTSVITLAPPVSTQSYALTFSKVSSNSITLNFTPGSIGASHLVVASAGSPLITALPVNQTSYTANINYGLGDPIGNGFVVNTGSSTSITVNNLVLATTYYFQVFDFSGSGGTENYFTNTASGNPASQSTLATTSVSQPTNLAFSNVTTTGAAVSFTAASGNPSGYLVLRSTDPSLPAPPSNGTTYAAGSSVGTATVAYSGSSSSFNEVALTAGTPYYYSAYSYNGSGSTINYLVTNPLQGSVITLPPNPLANAATATGSTYFTANWSATLGASDYHLDVSIDNFNTFVTGYSNLPVGSVISYSIVGLNSGASYQYQVRAHNFSGTSANSNSISVLTLPAAPTGLAKANATQNGFTASWTKAGGATAYFLDVAADSLFSSITYANISLGNTSSYVVSGLSSATTYFFRLRASNLTGVSANSTFVSLTTLAAPVTTQSSAVSFSAVSTTSVTLNFTPGSGTSHLVVVSEGSPLNALPSNRSTYTSKTAYSVGSKIGNGYVVNLGLSPITVTNLLPATTYYFHVFDFNGASGTENYNTLAAANNPASQITLSITPLTQPANLVFSNQTGSSVNVSFTAAVGNPNGYLVLRASGAQPTGQPVNGASYSTGTPLGNSNVVYAGSSLSFFDGGLPTGTKYFYNVYAFNGNGSSINYKTTSPLQGSVTLDVVPPTIRATSNPSTLSGATPFNAVITDNVIVDSAKIFYRGISQKIFKSAPMIPSGAGGNYSVQVQTSWYDSLGLEYYFWAIDENGNATAKPATISFAQLVFPSINLPALPAGSGQSSYRIVAFPYQLSTDNKVTTVYNNVPWNDNTKAGLWWWNPTLKNNAGGYDQYGPTSVLQTVDPGKGYWVVTSSPATPQLSNVTAPKYNHSNLYSMTLKPNWNQVGNPYPVPISWDEVKAFNPNSNFSPLNIYNDSGYNTASTLPAFEGGFVKNLGSSDITIQIPFLNQTSIGGRVASISSDVSQEAWNIFLHISQDGSSNRLGGFGMHPLASSGPDRFDNFNPPKFLDVPEVNFVNLDFAGATFSNDMVKSQPDYIWQFTPAGSLGKPAQLNWNPGILTNSSKQLFLLDGEQVKVIDMSSVSQYDFVLTSASRFRIFYGTNIQDKVTTQGVVASAPYPNPLTNDDKININLALPDSGSDYAINLQLFNGQGELIGSISETSTSGIYPLEWAGNSLVAGIYIYKLSVTSGQSSTVYTGKIVKP